MGEADGSGAAARKVRPRKAASRGPTAVMSAWGVGVPPRKRLRLTRRLG